MLFAEAIDEFLEAILADGCAVSTEKWYRQRLGQLAQHLSGPEKRVMHEAITGFLTSREARWASEKMYDLYSHTLRRFETYLKGNGYGLADAIEEYLIGEGLALKTIQAYRYGLKKLLAAAGNIELKKKKKHRAKAADHLAKAIRQCLSELEQAGKSPYTAHQVRRTCGTFFGWLVREGWLKYNPITRVRKIRLPKDEVPRLTDEERRIVLKAVRNNPRDYAIMCVLFDTMIRRGEATGLDIRDVDFTTRTIRVKRGKGKKYRKVPVGRVTLVAIRRYIGSRKTGPLFLSDKGECKGKRLSWDGLYRVVYRVSKKTGIKLYPHLARHTAAQDFRNLGGHIQECQQILGHEDVESTVRYTGDNSIENLVQKYEVASPIDNLLGKGEQLL